MKYVYDINENGYTVVLEDGEFREEEDKEDVKESNEESSDDIKDIYDKMLSNNLSQSEKISFSDDLNDLDVVGVCLLLLLLLVGAHYIVRGA